jgi:hypothetical protein
MLTGVLFWYGNEVGMEYEKLKAFPKEHQDVVKQRNDYRYLYNMLKERKGPMDTFQSLIPEMSYWSRSTEEPTPEQQERLEKKLDRSCSAVLQQVVLDSN